MSEIINLNKESFEKVTSSGSKTQIIDFWAPWCGPCKALTPVLEEVSTELADSVEVYKVNVDDNTETAPKYNVRGIPTLLVIKGGEVAATKVGAVSKSQLIEFVEGAL